MNSNPGCDKRLLRRGLLFCLCATFIFSTNAFTSGETPDARKIMEDVYRQDTSRNTSMRAHFEVFDKEGHVKRKEFTYQRVGSPGSSKTLVIFSGPAEIRGVALLSINQRGVTDRQYIYIPATQRVRSVVARERSARFIGTDFSFEDIAERMLDDFTYRFLGDAETIEGHKTYKVEATPIDPARSQYKYLYYWVAQDVPVILHAEMYDAQGKVLRVLHASGLRQVSGIWGARHIEMRSVQDGTRTVLNIREVKFNTNVNEKLFTPQGLEAAFVSATGK
jgi:hypothetical protein